MFKKIISYIACAILFTSHAFSITPPELNAEIIKAKQKLYSCELVLRKLEPFLTQLFLTERTNDDGHDAEIALRSKHLIEYMDYITAKSELDSLLYTQYLIFVNGKPE